MIVVTIELLPKGSSTGRRTIGVMSIANDGTGTEEIGNYVYAISHAGKHISKKGVYKKGKIRGFKRTLSPYRLVQRVLKDAGEI